MLNTGGVEGVHLTVVDSERGVHGGQVGEGNRGNVTESDVVGPLQAVKGHFNIFRVVGNLKSLRNRLQLRVDRVQVSVVVDVESFHVDDVEPFQRGQTGVGDVQRLNIGDTGTESDLLQSWQGDKVDGSNRGQVSQVERAQHGQIGHRKLTSDGSQRVSRKGSQRSGVVHNKTSVDGSNVGDSCGVQVTGNVQSSSQSVTRTQSVKVSLNCSCKVRQSTS